VFRSQKSKPSLGVEGLIGEIGEVRGKLTPKGKVFVHGEYWNAQADGEIDVGEKVKVVGYDDGMCLRVRPVSNRDSGN
jgi:membrane-bound serine protease (ClpP class)